MIARILFISLFLALTLPASASAQQLQKIYKQWSVFTLQQQGEKICYIASSPVSSSGNYKSRSEPYLIVTHRSKNVDEVSTASGYPYKQDSKVIALVDGKERYELFTSLQVPDTAWARDTTQDQKLVASMKKGLSMTVRGNSRLGTYSEDKYSLMGFTKAYRNMKNACK